MNVRLIIAMIDLEEDVMKVKKSIRMPWGAAAVLAVPIALYAGYYELSDMASQVDVKKQCFRSVIMDKNLYKGILDKMREENVEDISYVFSENMKADPERWFSRGNLYRCTLTPYTGKHSAFDPFIYDAEPL
jgi:hypothetical protein